MIVNQMIASILGVPLAFFGAAAVRCKWHELSIFHEMRLCRTVSPIRGIPSALLPFRSGLDPRAWQELGGPVLLHR